MESLLYSISVSVDPLGGLAQVQKHRLFENSSIDDSHVYGILIDCEINGLNTRHRDVLDLWLAHDPDGKPVGMALVTEERLRLRRDRVVNVFVRLDARGAGLGSALLGEATRRYPDLLGHHTADSIGLYERLGIPDYFREAAPLGAVGKRTLQARYAEMRLAHDLARLHPQLLDLTGGWPDEGIGPGRAHRSHVRRRR